MFISQIRLDHFVPVLVLFVREPSTEKATSNFVSAQNVYAKVTLIRQFKYNIIFINCKWVVTRWQ
jgi:hypothetical protein